MDTSVKLIGFLDIFTLALFMMIPGQCFWTGLAIAKRSMRNAVVYLAGSAAADICVYGILNEFGGKFLEQINQSTLNIARGLVLVAIGLFTVCSIWQNTSQNASDSEKITSTKNLLLRSGEDLKTLLLGASLVFTNPMVYALLIPYTEPLVKLQHHWLIYAVFMYILFIPTVYIVIYCAAFKIEKVLKGIWGKLFWSGIAFFPIYYGVDILLHVL